MGNYCRKNKVRDPKRKDIDELAERERLEKEAEKQREEQPEELEEQNEEPPEEPPENEEDQDDEDDKDDEPEEATQEESKSFEEKPIDDLDRSNSELYSESQQKYDNGSEKMETGTQLTLSTEATGAVQQVTKLSEPAHEESIYNTYRSVTPCDMNKVDETAKVFSRRCGCDLGDRHDENTCKICRKIDLSDTPLLN
ncbi:glideosome-associated protein 45, putative [Plasmodium gallinaceum]|uniref:Glideosome-associated protein 45, putative n=1 Tax=Plasmodium gallinaceum TaxID=5849 RepID=A0A1J1GMH2_PLAGA|nr:glideosome-associated protein 45, putative [Plasmodium gallinaceum]CRG93531.1 glideosome-associated protein 45, putative [Plasmodium gallinaceum]